MLSDGDDELGGLGAQLVSKEREWKELLAARVHQLESFLRKAQEENSVLRKRYQQLQEDFQFNLAVLDERDRELERYDIITARTLTVEHNRQEKRNQLHMQLTQLEEQRARETEESQMELSKCRQSAAQHKLQLDELKSSMVGEIQKQTEKYERMKWDLQCRIHRMEEELTLQRQEMTAAHDSELREKQHEFNLKMHEMHAAVLSHTLKVELLSKEAEVHRQAHFQATEALKASQQLSQQLQTQLQQKEQEIKDLTAVKDHRMKKLEGKLKRMETKLKEEEDDHIKKCQTVIRALKEYDVQQEVQYQAHAELLQRTERRLAKLQEKTNVLAARVHGTQKNQQEVIGRKDETIRRLLTEVETARNGWDKYITQVSAEIVAKDTEIITLQERETRLRTERDRNVEEVEGYKQQLSAGLRRERALEQKQVQVELEWQRRCEDIKAEHYLANEQLIQDLTQARDQARTELKEKEQELQDLKVLLRSVTMERDQTLQGLTPKVDSMASEEICRLQEQNSVLRAVVTQMRKDMERLSQLQLQPQASSPQPPHQDAPVVTGQPAQPPDISSSIHATDCTQALAQEVSLLKDRCRHLEKQLEGAFVPRPAPPTEEQAPTASGSTQLQDQGLNRGGLCLGKHENTSAFMKLGVRVEHGTKKSAQLQESNPCLQQQRASGLISGALFEHVQSAESNCPLLHTRLKQAALYIARLSKEKQQLIEMGNRLRAQVTSAGLKECFPERDSSTEKLQDQNNKLSALEQLQYQHTTQELQFALRQMACALAEQQPPEMKDQDCPAGGAADPQPQGHETTHRPESSKNKDSTPPLSQWQSTLGPQPHTGQSRCLLSSEESLRSLNELWQILDHGLSPSIVSEGEDELRRREVAGSGPAGVQMVVHGISAPMHSQPQTEVQQRRNRSTAPSNSTNTSRPGAPQGSRKIRNYNVKQ